MQYTASYYSTVCLQPDTWHIMNDCVCIATPTQIVDIVPYTLYKKIYSSLPLHEHQGFYLPAFINAHTHLDNIYLQGKTTKQQGFYKWLLSVLEQRKDESTIKEYCYNELNNTSSIAKETALITTIASAPWLHTLLSEYAIPHYIFYESIGQYPSIPQLTTTESLFYTSYAGHALYSTSSATLYTLKQRCSSSRLPFSIHLAEHQEESDFLHGIQNDFTRLLSERLMPSFIPPNMSPVEYALSLRLLDEKTLAVHCVHLLPSDIDILKHTGVTVCLCPRSNAYIGVGTANALALYNAHIPLCIATDGLASNTSLSLWEEIRFAMEIYSFTLQQSIPMVTTNPARILGVEQYFGKIAKGCYPKLTPIPNDMLPL